jgi:hypothetical protein
VKFFVCAISTILLSSCATVQTAPVSPVSLVLQGVRFYFSSTIPAEIPVEAVGTGSTREKAIDNALIAAVQQAIGVLVVSDVTVESNKVVRDIAINYASGVVKEYSVKQCTDTTRIQCTIKAKVSPFAFQQKLLASASVTKIDGENLYGQYLTSRNAIIQRYRVTEYFFSRIRTQGIQAKLIRFEVQPTISGKVPIYIEYSIRMNPSYKKTLIELLEKLQEDTGAKPNIWTGERQDTARGVSPHTVYIQWGPTGFLQNRVWVHTYDRSFAVMMQNYQYQEISIKINELGICDKVSHDDIFKIDWYGLTRRGTIEIDPEKLKGVKQVTLEAGC